MERRPLETRSQRAVVLVQQPAEWSSNNLHTICSNGVVHDRVIAQDHAVLLPLRGQGFSLCLFRAMCVMTTLIDS